MDNFVVQAAFPGADPEGMLCRMLPEGCVYREYDLRRPLQEQVEDANVLLVRSGTGNEPITAAIMDAAPGLVLIQRPGPHVDSIDFSYAARRGIYVCNVPAGIVGGGRGIAEHALFLMLAVAKRYEQGRRQIAARQVGLRALRLGGRTLGLLGLGRTARHLVPMARALDMGVIALKIDADEQQRQKYGLDWLGGPGDLTAFLERADVVSLHLPLTADTEGYIGHEQLISMRDGTILVNTARAGLVDYDALMAALAVGKLAGYGTDVMWKEPADPSDPLFAHPNVVVTPHLSHFTDDEHARTALAVVGNIESVRRVQAPDHILNEGA